MMSKPKRAVRAFYILDDLFERLKSVATLGMRSAVVEHAIAKEVARLERVKKPKE
jgi:hypothetical protein